jgi:hypothetical protein
MFSMTGACKGHGQRCCYSSAPKVAGCYTNKLLKLFLVLFEINLVDWANNRSWAWSVVDPSPEQDVALTFAALTLHPAYTQ